MDSGSQLESSDVVDIHLGFLCPYNRFLRASLLTIPGLRPTVLTEHFPPRAGSWICTRVEKRQTSREAGTQSHGSVWTRSPGFQLYKYLLTLGSPLAVYPHNPIERLLRPAGCHIGRAGFLRWPSLRPPVVRLSTSLSSHCLRLMFPARTRSDMILPKRGPQTRYASTVL